MFVRARIVFVCERAMCLCVRVRVLCGLAGGVDGLFRHVGVVARACVRVRGEVLCVCVWQCCVCAGECCVCCVCNVRRV